MYINSPGGIVTSGLAIYDTMQHSPGCGNSLYWPGSFDGIATLKLATGKRYSLPHSRIMTHQPLAFSGSGNRYRDLQKKFFLRGRLNKIYEHHSDKNLKQIEKIMERDNFAPRMRQRKWGD